MKPVLGLLVCMLPLLSAAEVVVPIDSVENHVNIRMSPDAKSEIVGKLRQGDSVPLVQSVPDWHEVEIAGGATGFISADWTNVLDEARAPVAAVEQLEETTEEPAETAASAPAAEPEAAEEVVEEPAEVAEAEPTQEAVEDPVAVADSEQEEEADEAPAEVAETEAVEEATEDSVEVAETQAEQEVEAVPDTETVVDTESEAVEPVEEVVAEDDYVDESVATETTEPAPVAKETIVQVVVGAAGEPGPPGPPGMMGPPGPQGPLGPSGAATIEGSKNFLMKFTTPTIGGNSQVFDDGNKIGIGTTEPKQRLEVNGNIQIHERNSSVAGLLMTQSSGETGYIMHNRASTLTIGAGSVDRITIDREGNVGFGTTRPVHPIEMASGAYVSAGGVWTNSSSRDKKENIVELTPEEALAALTKLEPVTFNYKQDRQEQYVGFIAEDVPELVASTDRTGLSAMDIVAVLTRVVQLQQQRIADLESRLERRE